MPRCKFINNLSCEQVSDRIVELESENSKLREENKRLRGVAIDYYTEMLNSDDVLGQIMARKKLRELGIEVGEQ